MPMKKGLSIIVSFVLILMLTVSFSFRSEAAGSYSRINFDNYTITGSFTIRLVGDELIFSDGKGSTTTAQNYGSTAVVFPISFAVPFWQINHNAAVRATGGSGLYIFTPKITLTSEYPDSKGITFTSAVRNPRIYFQDQFSYMNNNSISYFYFDCSDPFNRSINIQDMFFMAFDFTFSGGALDGATVTYTYTFELTGHSMQFYPTDEVDSTVMREITEDQTNTVTKGYDNSGMENTNDSLSSSLSDYDEKEGQITDQSVGYIDDAAFISPSSNATILASISFCTSWLQSLFVNLGDWSILVTVSLSLALGLMLIGWFKYR